jgi:hypothetical protein
MAAVGLSSLRRSLCSSLPCDLIEVLVISFVASGDDQEVGRIHAPSSIPVSSLAMISITKRVIPGRTAVFKLVDEDGESRLPFDKDALTSLARVVRPLVELIIPPATNISLSATVHLSSLKDCVVVCALVPDHTPLGAEVILRRVTVGGIQIAAGIGPSRAVVGCNHAISPCGPVFAAAKVGDTDALLQSLEDGGSTEERVSHLRHTLNVARL